MFCFKFLLYYFNSFSQYFYFEDSYEAFCAKENIATLQSDFNSISETEQNMGIEYGRVIEIRDQQKDLC